VLGAAGQAIYNAERFSQQNVKFHKVPELFPNRKVRTVRTEQLCFHTQTIRNSGLPFNGRHPHNPCKLHGLIIIIIIIITHLPTPNGWKAELAWLV